MVRTGRVGGRVRHGENWEGWGRVRHGENWEGWREGKTW